MNRSLIAAFPAWHGLRAPTLPNSPRAFHVAVITRCLIALLFASGCVSTPAYEQVSSAVEVEREAHRRTHAALEEKEAKLKELEGSPSQVAQTEAPKAIELVCPGSRDKELAATLKARETELVAQKKRTIDLGREKAALARLVDEREAELRTLRQRESVTAIVSTLKVARETEEKARDEEAGLSRGQEHEAAFVPDSNAPEPLPSEPTSIESE